LLILVTPHLVDAMTCDQLPKHLPGQESRIPDDFELFLEGILEAPRGQRNVIEGNRYNAAHNLGPTADVYPCGMYGCGNGGNGSCGIGMGASNCANCSSGTMNAIPAQPQYIQQQPGSLPPAINTSTGTLPTTFNQGYPRMLPSGTEEALIPPPGVLGNPQGVGTTFEPYTAVPNGFGSR
jgi:pilus assembly protein CpaC